MPSFLRFMRISNPPWQISLLLPLLLAGCTTWFDTAPNPRKVSLADFKSTETVVSEEVIDEQPQTDEITNDVESSPETQLAEESPDSEVAQSEPNDESTLAPYEEAMKPGDLVFVDRMVGQVNGRPVFADEFFEPIADELRAESEQLNRQEFIVFASDLVDQRLREVVLSELFLAEAETELSEEQQLGLFYWLRDLRETVIGQLGAGSTLEAEQKIAESEGISVEEFVQAKRDSALIAQLLRDEIKPRVIVSWRDVTREYEKEDVYATFNPPGSVTILRIRLNTERKQAEIEQVQQRIDSGEPFTEIAEFMNMPDEGKLGTFELGDGGVNELNLSEVYRQNLVGLQQGQTSEPFVVGSSTTWLHISEIQYPTNRSIYDAEVQLGLTEMIRDRRFNEEQNKYIESLFEQGIYDELNEMNARLLDVAMLRYGP